MAIDPNRVKDLFLAAAELPDAQARTDYLDRECGPDVDLRARVEALLRAHDDPDSFIGHATDPAATRTLDRDAGGDPAAVGPRAEDVEEALGFLGPAGRPDSLGRIGHYEVLEVLGRGAFGIVFRAFDDNLQRVVAVKVLAPHMAATSPARKRFIREARSSAQVRHENVVQVYEVSDQVPPYLAMEYIPGETLQQRLDRSGPIDVPEVLRIGRQIADGLAAAHAQDLIHRDVKPANILIEAGPQHRVKLTDFGLARAADDASISQSGVVAGTPMYMAPEQAQGEALDHRADLFSLGSVLYQMASGRPPFRASSTLAVLKRVAEDEPRPIREIIPEVPEWLCRVIAKLHAKRPDDRFQTAREVADVLADCEQQIKTHGVLRDYSRIPGGEPRAARSRLKRAAATGGLVAFAALMFVVILCRGSIYRYAANRGEIEFTGGTDPDVEKVLVRRDGELIATLDWTNRNAVLAPGEYELEAVCVDGYEATKFNVDTTRFLTFTYTFARADDRPAIKLNVRRGDSSIVAVTAERRAGSPVTAPGPWVSLFNGKDLTGWKKHPRLGGFWHVDENGVLIATGPVEQSYLATERGDFEHFHLRMELKVDGPTSDSGVFLRVPFPEFKDFAEVNIGFDTNRPSEQTGSAIIQHAGGVQLRPAPAGLAAAGRWFTLDIIVQGDELRTLVNGKPGVTTTLPPGRRRGHLFLQQAGDKAAVRFRKIEIKELPAGPPAEPWVSLFNGKNLRGWKTHPDAPGNWTVGDGVLKGSGKSGTLFTDRGDYENFRLRAEVRLNVPADAGIQFRAPHGVVKVDADSQRFAVPDCHLLHFFRVGPFPFRPTVTLAQTGKAGMPADLNAARPGVVRPDEWLTVELTADGNLLAARLNGQEWASYTDPQKAGGQGHVALTAFTDDTVIEVRKIEIQELPPTGAGGGKTDKP
jgi:hypothetical protein